jgi:N-formylglutamate deformylase
MPADGAGSPVVLSSPHSGRLYPPDLVAVLRLPPAELRGLEDGPVDRLAEAGCAVGGTLIAATYPRAYVDLNRDPAELDPEIVGFTPGDYRLSAKVRAGLGVIPTRLGSSALYARSLAPATVERRLRTAWRPTTSSWPS